MNKKSKTIIGMLMIFSLGFIVIIKFSFSNEFKISIANNTNKTVTNLELKYKEGTTIQTISQIEPKKSWKGKIDTNSIQGENAIILIYNDNKGNPYEEYIVGYLEKGYSGHTNVVINKIDENGKLEIVFK